MDIEVSGEDDIVVIRFLNESENFPVNNSKVIVLHPDISQLDVGAKGVAYGKLACTEFIDVESGVLSLKIRVRRPGATTSIMIAKEGWAKQVTIGVLLDGQ